MKDSVVEMLKGCISGGPCERCDYRGDECMRRLLTAALHVILTQQSMILQYYEDCQFIMKTAMTNAAAFYAAQRLENEKYD